MYGNDWKLIGKEYPNMTYHMFLLHSRFKYDLISKWMGDSNQTVYITMIRDPVDIFVSAWDYYKLEGNYKMTLQQFASSQESVTRRRSGQSIGPNQLLWDLGVDDIYNDEAVQQRIKLMDEKFHLVMILENFEESLILMKHLLCWEDEDITNLKLNARTQSVDDIINSDVRRKLKVILAQDYKVYSHFKAKFQNRLESFGYDRMVEEMKALRRANEAVMKKCEFSAADNNKIKGVNKWWGPANLVGYLVEDAEDEECELMAMSELSYVNRVRNIQKQKYPEKPVRKTRQRH